MWFDSIINLYSHLYNPEFFETRVYRKKSLSIIFYRVFFLSFPIWFLLLLSSTSLFPEIGFIHFFEGSNDYFSLLIFILRFREVTDLSGREPVPLKSLRNLWLKDRYYPTLQFVRNNIGDRVICGNQKEGILICLWSGKLSEVVTISDYDEEGKH